MTALLGSPAPARGSVVEIRCDLNESAHPPLPSVIAALRDHVGAEHRYPPMRPDAVRRAVAHHLGVTDDQVTVGAGATAVAVAILADCALRARRRGVTDVRIATPVPTFDGFGMIADMLGLRLDPTPLTADGRPDLDALAERSGPRTAALIVCSPHNPTGAVVGETALRTLLRAVAPEVTVILDQAYVEYCTDPPDIRSMIRDHPNLVVVRTFSKAYGLAGLRVGYALGSRATIAAARAHEVPFSVGAAAHVAVPIALAAQRELAQRTRSTRTERDRLATMLGSMGCHVLPGEANFVYLPGPDGIAIGHTLRTAGVITREFGNHGCRVTVGDRRTTDHIVAAVRTAALLV
jgi:histidinol-phosphate aminotransferase